MYYILQFPKPVGLEPAIRTVKPEFDSKNNNSPTVLEYKKMIDAKTYIRSYFKDPNKEITVFVKTK